MARLFMDGWEHGRPSSVSLGITGDYFDSLWQFYRQDELSLGSRSSFSSNNSVTNLSGAYSLDYYFNGATFAYGMGVDCCSKLLSSTYNKLYARMYYRKSIGVANNSTNWYIDILSFDDTNPYGNSMSMQLKVRHMTNEISLYVNGSEVANISNVIINNTWHLVEVLYDSSSSNIIVKVDGSSIIDYSGSIDSSIIYVSLLKTTTSYIDYSSFHYYIDDFAINDDSGSINNSWIGAGVIRLIKPTSDDTNADFTPSTGIDHYALVDDFPDDGDTTYNSSTVSGDIDTFGLESVPSVAAGQTINAVQAVYRARSETDIASVAPILISGTTTDTGATQSTVLSDYNDTKQKVYDVDPNGSIQWTETNVNALKGGYKNAT